MGDLIAIITMMKDMPSVVSITLIIITVIITLFIRVKDKDIQSITSVSRVQNEKLVALMDQNEQLMKSVDILQKKVHLLHIQMTAEAEEHRLKLEQTYKVVDEMRCRITELEELVRIYQRKRYHECDASFCPNRGKNDSN